ncbi:MAG: YolD-like family protein [Bacillus sp. (in: firmicutes)]
MKPNKMTPGYNLMWESSRMMLPEHKQVLQRHQKELTKKTKPIMDEQQIALFSMYITRSIEQGLTLKIQLFHEYEDVYFIGKVQKILVERKEIKISHAKGSEYIGLDEMIDIQIME